MVIHPEWQELLKVHGLNTVRGVYENSAGRSIASSGTTEVREVELRSKDSAQPRVIFIKRYWFPSFGSRWNGALRGTLFGRSKVRREFDNLAWLRAHGFDAPLPIAWGEERSGGWLARSLLISEGIPQPVALSKFIRDTLPSRPAATRRDLIERLAALTRRLHEQRFVHHDLFWRNIILTGETLERFALIDAHKGRVWRAGAAQQSRAADLAALDAPAPWYFRRTERLRFFLRYRGHARLTPEDKALLRATLRLAEPMRERQLARVTGVKRARS
jgi:tRNA A-37 threonylcarbamoyl transferase component Bud32